MAKQNRWREGQRVQGTGNRSYARWFLRYRVMRGNIAAPPHKGEQFILLSRRRGQQGWPAKRVGTGAGSSPANAAEVFLFYGEFEAVKDSLFLRRPK